MTHFDKSMAREEIEDALSNIGTAHGRGLAIGLCGGFYMSGLLSTEEWQNFLGRIPAEPQESGINKFEEFLQLCTNSNILN